MKFGKSLHNQIDAMPAEWRDQFLSYKPLKKWLKGIKAIIRFREAAFSSSFGPQHEVTSGCEERVGITNNVAEGVRLSTIPADDVKGGRTTGEKDTMLGCVEVVALKRVREVEGEGMSAGLMNLGASPLKKRAVGEGTRETSTLIGVRAVESGPVSIEDSEFVRLLNVELDKFNRFFVEKEEDFVIRLQELKERIEKVMERRGAGFDATESICNEEMIKIRQDIVRFHGEMVLLENYSSLNYTGLVKIVKKHDKTTNGVLRLPYIQSVLHQPFFTTELLSKLVLECQTILLQFFSSSPGHASPKNLSEQAHVQSVCLSRGEEVETILRGTRAALRTIEDIRKSSSTYSALSIPPLRRRDSEEGFGLVNDEKVTEVV